MGHGRRRRAWLVCAVVAAVLVVGAVAAVLVPLPVYVRTHNFDVKGGRVRRQTMLVGITVSEKMERTSLSKLYEDLLGPLPSPRWELDDRFQPGISVQCAYSGSIWAAGWLPEVLASPVLSDAARRTALETFLRLLRDDGNSGRGIEYAFSLAEWLGKQPDTAPAGSLGPDDLPGPPELR